MRREGTDTITGEGRFFAEPRDPRHRQYEALRAYFLEGLKSSEAARRFGYQAGSFRILCWRFRHGMDRDEASRIDASYPGILPITLLGEREGIGSAKPPPGCIQRGTFEARGTR